jgi:alpha-L-fucosidase
LSDLPRYLGNYRDLWAGSPKEANLAWWKEARFGLFIHYGLYSQLKQGEWVQFHNRIPVADYERLQDTFDPSGFDADFVTDLACEAEMRYVNLVSCHHDSFALWDSRTEEFNSVNAPAHRDLVGELAEACAEKGLGFFTYYTYHQNWRHPYFLSRDYYKTARPDYDSPDPHYRFQNAEDFQIYVEYAHNCITELLTGYGPLAGMWLDLIMGYYAAPQMMPVQQTYDLVHRLQPHTLVSFKQGATGTEDFATPERHFHSLEERARDQFGEEAARVARLAWEKNRDKHNEICATLQGHKWAYAETERHLNALEVRGLLAHALSNNANLLLNTGPRPDGSIPEADVETLREVGRRIRSDGWPSAEEAALPGEESSPGGAAGQ